MKRNNYKKIAVLIVLSMLCTLSGFSSIDVKSAFASSNNASSVQTIKLKSSEWSYGADGDCRLELGNKWCRPSHDFSDRLKQWSFTGIDVSFYARGVDSSLEAINDNKAEAQLNFDSNNDDIYNFTDGGVVTTTAKLTKDAYYTVSYRGDTLIEFKNYMAVRIPALDDASYLQFEDVQVTLYGAVQTGYTPMPSETPAPIAHGIPNYSATQQTRGTDDDFRVGLSYVSANWKETNYTDFSTEQVMQIKGEGEYSASYTIATNYDMGLLWLDTNLYKGSKMEVDVTGVTITAPDKSVQKQYTLNNGRLRQPGSLWGYRNTNDQDNYAATIMNQYLRYEYYISGEYDNYRRKYVSYNFNAMDGVNLLPESEISVQNGSIITVNYTVKTRDDYEENGGNLQCNAACTVDIGRTESLCARAYGNSLEDLKKIAGNVTWISSNTKVAQVNNYGFILPKSAKKLATDSGSKDVWEATGLLSVTGITEGTATITGMAADGSATTCEVTVTTPTSDSGTTGNGGSLILGEDVSGTTDDETAKFFPQNWTLKISSFPITITRKVDQEDGSYTIRGSVGIGKSDWLDKDAKWTTFKKDVEEAKKNLGKYNCLEKHRKTWDVKKKNAMNVSKFSKTPSISLMGYFENKYDRDGNKITGTGALAMDAEWKGSVSWQFATPIGPMYLNLSGSGKLSGEIRGEYDYSKRNFPSLDGSVKITPAISLEGGYGIDKVAVIGAKGTISFPVTILPATKGEFQAEAGVHVKVAFVIDWNHTLAKKSWTLWDTTGKKKLGILDDISLNDGVLSAMDTSFAEAESKWYPKKDPSSSSRKKAQMQSDTRGIVTTLKEGILPASLPQQAQIGDRKVMVYQAYDASRETLDSSVLKYSVWDNGSWSEDRPVCDDGNADLFADMKVVNGKLVLVWQKQKAETAGDISADSDAVLKEMAQNSEIYCSIFDEETGTFGEAVRVTDNDVCDMMPQICANGEDITVAWVRNDAGDMMQESGNNSICTAKWNGTDFDGEEVLSQAPGTIDSYTVYEKDGKTEAVYDGQANGINAVFDTNGQVIPALDTLVMGAEDADVSSLQYTDGTVSMVVNGTLYRYQISDGSVTSFSAGESAFGSAVQYCTNGDKSGYIWSRYEEETGKGQILASMKTEDGWSEPVVVCEQEGTYWRYFSPILKEDGDWEIVANAENANSGLNALVDITKERANHLQLVSAYVDESNIQDGKTAVRYMVTNTEDTAIDHLDLLIKLADGTIVKKTISVNIAPGASVVDTAYVDLSDVDTEQSVNISAVAEGQDDTTDSSVTDQVGQADVAVEASGEETEDQLTITAVVKNPSTMAADMDVYLYGDEKKSSLLQSRKGITLQADGSKQLTFTVDKKDITYNKNKAAYLTLYAEPKGGDYDMDNNTAYVILYQEDQEPSATPTVSPTTKPTVKPTARPTVTPGANIAKNPTQSSAAPNTSAQKLRKGQLVKNTKTKAYYKILSITSSGGTVAYVKPAGKKSKSITIATSTVLDGHIFKAVAVSAKACKGCSKLQKVTISKNITSIGKNAFRGCKNLKIIVIKSTKLTSRSIGSNAFKGTHKKLVIKVPKKMLKKYKKFLKKKGNKNVKVVKA